MYAPIFHPLAAGASVDVAAAERAILAEEGAHHVDGRYVADARLAARLRRATAERRVTFAARRAAYLTTRPLCAWCSEAVTDAVQALRIAGDLICGPCVPDYEATVFGGTPRSVDELAPVVETAVTVVAYNTGNAAAHVAASPMTVPPGAPHADAAGEARLPRAA